VTGSQSCLACQEFLISPERQRRRRQGQALVSRDRGG